ncbi:uncharacterized protein FPRO_15285 [Fusarium proliferatum ET1]|uniref:mRNA stability protein n=1 Tax=Fusarium proliferatum (strain ET1) TaxID=1227346 RepID=A0A1L7VYL5_FUSPR|nr:uncharacterized protein FPRO_15285 [Fusarium proliferatum ET1]CZR45539.1 uncharacterized protein FPRO_15285 [Fusarium proliferatum ET1]
MHLWHETVYTTSCASRALIPSEPSLSGSGFKGFSGPHFWWKGRKYFDSGDFALNQAHRSSNIGNVTTGQEHPIRQEISEPSSSVPSSSNIDDNATQPSSTRQRSPEVKFHAQTHLHQEMESPPESEHHRTDERNNG